MARSEFDEFSLGCGFFAGVFGSGAGVGLLGLAALLSAAGDPASLGSGWFGVLLGFSLCLAAFACGVPLIVRRQRGD